MKKSSTIKLDMSGLLRIKKESPVIFDRAIRKVAFDMQADIGDNFSTSSPSAPGEAPGIQSGNLKNNMEVKQVRQGVWAVRVKTRYGPDLEFGTVHMAARPFMRPGALRALARLPAAFKGKLK